MILSRDWRDFENRPGVYEMHFQNGVFYIGKSKNVQKRLSEHLSRLKRGIHNNSRMQSAFRKYKKVFFNVIQYCETDNEAISAERQHIAAHRKNKKCANVSSGDWVMDGDYIKYFTKSTLWVYLPTGQTHRTESRDEWDALMFDGKRIQLRRRSVMAIAESREHAAELHRKYWVEWTKREAVRLDREAARLELQRAEEKEKREKKIRTWWYHMRNKNTGRVTLARDTYEWKRFKPCEGWECRRYGEQWPERKVGTPPKKVHGYHPTHGKREWPSIGLCAKHIRRTHMSTLKAIRGERKTCGGWTLSFTDDGFPSQCMQANLFNFTHHGVHTTQAPALALGEGEDTIRGGAARSALLDCNVAASEGGTYAGAPVVPDVRASRHTG